MAKIVPDSLVLEKFIGIRQGPSQGKLRSLIVGDGIGSWQATTASHLWKQVSELIL
jgi:hypothetical protein